ncbi:Uncharacterised protein [uncultured archaeon]|nr:Uncharacterised protein [uncultured archaeon]
MAILESRNERVKLLKKGFSGKQIEMLYVILNSLDVVSVDWQDNEIPGRSYQEISGFIENKKSVKTSLQSSRPRSQ